jgi:predicted permease
MGMACSNSGFVGYPIVLLTFPPVAGLVLALNMIIENVLVIPLLLALAERGRGHAVGWRGIFSDTLGRLARNPMVLGVFAALAFSVLELRLPAAASRTVDLFALASTALSLFVIGGTLVGLPVKGIARKVVPIAMGKLVLHPLAVFLVAVALAHLGWPAMEPTLFQAAVLMAAMPMMGIYPVLSQEYGLEDLSAAALLLTTVASFFSINALLWMMRTGLVTPW